MDIIEYNGRILLDAEHLYQSFWRSRQVTIDWLQQKFAKLPAIAKANIAALNAGHAFGETAELSGCRFSSTALYTIIATLVAFPKNGPTRRSRF